MHSTQSGQRTAYEAEIRSAVESLSKKDLLDLDRFARRRLLVCGVRHEGHEPHDIVADAVLQTLQRTRQWHPEVIDFKVHLYGVIRSRVSHLAERRQVRRGKEPQRPSTALEREDESVAGPREPEEGSASPEENCHAAQVLERIEAALADDPSLLSFCRSVARHAGAPFLGPLIRVELGITQAQYCTLKARLYARVSKIVDSGEVL